MTYSQMINTVDEQYLNCLKEILHSGYYKNTRSGEVVSLFGLSMRFKLKDGFPILTTKKMFYKGFIHELLWFLKGDTNIKYLVDNNVNFWTPDAYRFYNELLDKQTQICGTEPSEILRMTQEEFVKKVKAGEGVYIVKGKNENGNLIKMYYRFGDLGPVYGKQWRHWGNSDFDQIKMIINTLKKNPYDRRLLLTGYNPDVRNDIALPPCHTLYQFYARPLSYSEKLDWCYENLPEANEWKAPTEEMMKSKGCPDNALSLFFHCRSQDMPLGNPANLMSASLLLSMIAQCADMIPDELVWNGGDCHIYTNQIDGIKKQLERDPHKYALPKLWLNPEIKHIDDFTFDDIKIEGYESYPTIKMPLSVG